MAEVPTLQQIVLELGLASRLILSSWVSTEFATTLERRLPSIGLLRWIPRFARDDEITARTSLAREDGIGGRRKPSSR